MVASAFSQLTDFENVFMLMSNPYPGIVSLGRYSWRYAPRPEIMIERSCCCGAIERAILTGSMWRANLLELGMSRIVGNFLKLVRLDIFIDDFCLYPLPARLFVHFSS